MTTGRAAVFLGPKRPFEIRPYPLPKVEPGAILVRVRLCTVCGSDIHIWKGEAPWRAFPAVLGHEMVGTVDALGDGVRSDSLGRPLSPGDRVTYQYFYPCGACYNCASGEPAACLNKNNYWALSSSDESPHFRGGFAEYYYLPPRHWVFKVPPDLPDEYVAPVNCALSQVIYSLSRAGVRPGQHVVVQGAGGLGLYACAVAKEMGAAQVIAIDGIAERLRMAAAFGADRVINLAEVKDARERVDMVRRVSDGRGGADVVVEVAGVPQAIPEGISMVRAGGTYLVIGSISRGAMAEIDPSQLVLFSRKMIGVMTYEPWAVPHAISFLQRAKDKYPFGKLLSHKFPLDEVNRAFEMSIRGEVIRAALTP
ncbi:MAG: zinc-binding dehydrogenase [Chloroflexi bacterium]|nr:zinc-binding dehydrogenase [Chloroflexota bacterium]